MASAAFRYIFSPVLLLYLWSSLIQAQSNVSAGRVNTSQRNNTSIGTYAVHSGRLTVQASAHAATAGFFWIINPVGSTAICYVNSITFANSPAAVTAFASTPRITVERVTFTGTASGATITPALFDSAFAANTCTVRSASTGLALSAGAVLFSYIVPAILTAVGQSSGSPQFLSLAGSLSGTNGLNIVLRAGEGLVVRQPDAGSTSDTRIVFLNLAWDEAS